MHCGPLSDLVPPVATHHGNLSRNFSSSCIVLALPERVATIAPDADLIEDVRAGSNDFVWVAQAMRRCFVGCGNNATAHKRSTDDNVKKQARVSIVVRDSKRSA